MGGYKTWSPLEEVTAANMNSFVRDNTVPQFANAAARTAAIVSPVVGTASYLLDTGSYEVYYGATTGWRKPWSEPWGNVLYQTYATQQTGNFTQTWSVNIVKDRRYMITMTGQFRNSVDACGVNFSSTFDGTTTAALTATVPGANRENVASLTHVHVAGSTKTANVGFVISTANGGTHTWNPTGFAPTYFTVTDIGPNVTTPPAS